MSHPKDVHSLSWEGNTIYTWRLNPREPLTGAPVAVMMHGAGTADSSRAYGIAQAFADCGVTVVSLDFVGHGQTGGLIATMSLKRRTELALAVIRHWTADAGKLILCGFSMSGHTVLRLTGQLGDRVSAISIMAPGVYAKAAEEVLFGDDFSRIIRVENSWQDSLALEDGRRFSGKVHMLTSSHDQVIPWGVAERLLSAFRLNAAEIRFDVLKEPDHKVAIWLSERPERSHDIMSYLLAPGPNGRILTA